VISGLFSIPMRSASGTPQRALPTAPQERRDEPRFIVGPENALVRELVRAVTSSTPTYNPLVLYGPSGVGKSTLAHLLADLWQRAHSGAANVLRTTAADLARALAHAAETSSVADLRTRYQRCDLLLIDDVHRLADRPAAQQFLTTTFDALVRRGVLVIATCRHLPGETASLLPLLASRLSAGLIVPLVPPAAAAREEIVRQLADQLDFRLSADATARLVGAHRKRPAATTVPQLRHALMQLSSAENHASPNAQPDGNPSCHKALFRQIAAAVARHFEVTIGDLKGPSRRQHVVEARSTAMYLCRTLTDASLAEVGRHFGGRDHTTVIHACQKINDLARRELSFARTLTDLATQIDTDPRP
jgi:chromosomal replication initiator protein